MSLPTAAAAERMVLLQGRGIGKRYAAPVLADGRVLATVDQFGAKQAVFGIDTALKAIKDKKAQKDLAPVVETQVTLITK